MHNEKALDLWGQGEESYGLKVMWVGFKLAKGSIVLIYMIHIGEESLGTLLEDYLGQAN